MSKSKRKAVCVSSTAHARGTRSDQCDLSRSPAPHLCPQCCWQGQPRGQLHPSPSLCPQGSCTEQMSVPQLWTQGCWPLRLDGDLVADASCSESPWMDKAAPPVWQPCRGSQPLDGCRQGSGGWSLPAVWHGAENATSASHSHCLGLHREFGAFLQE